MRSGEWRRVPARRVTWVLWLTFPCIGRHLHLNPAPVLTRFPFYPLHSLARCSKLVDGAYKRTKALLGQHAEALRGVAELLLARETINQNDLVAIAGARPWGINAQLKPYVDMMYDEEKEKEENKEGEKAKEGGADSTGASTSGAPGTDAAAPASASTETAPIGAAGEKKE